MKEMQRRGLYEIKCLAQLKTIQGIIPSGDFPIILPLQRWKSKNRFYCCPENQNT